MSFFHLKIKETGGKMILTIPLYSRIILAIFALAMTAVLLADGFSIVGAGILIIILAGLFYIESWVFSPEAGIITYRFGVLFPFTNKTYNISEISELVYSTHIKGNLTARADQSKGKLIDRTFYKLSLSDEDFTVIDTVTGRAKGERLKETAERIASFCSLSLKTE